MLICSAVMPREQISISAFVRTKVMVQQNQYCSITWIRASIVWKNEDAVSLHQVVTNVRVPTPVKPSPNSESGSYRIEYSGSGTSNATRHWGATKGAQCHNQ